MFSSLRNRYYLLRHGRSLANRAGLIISSPVIGISGWGLAEGACPEIIRSLEGRNLSPETVFYSSPFKRALETAECAAESIGSEIIIEASELGERYFGEFDEGGDHNYSRVWQLDSGNPDNNSFGAESPRSVFRRLSELINRIDLQYESQTLVLVSHGDPLDILLTAAAGMDVGSHRDIEPMKTAELRHLLPPVSSGDC